MKSFFKLHRKATVCAAVVLVLAVTAAIAMPRLFKPEILRREVQSQMQ